MKLLIAGLPFIWLLVLIEQPWAIYLLWAIIAVAVCVLLCALAYWIALLSGHDLEEKMKLRATEKADQALQESLRRHYT